MKMIRLIMTCVIILTLNSAIQGQKFYRDSLFWFKLEPKEMNELFVFEKMDVKGSFAIPKSAQKSIVIPTKNVQKQLKLKSIPKDVKMIKGPLVLKRGDKCFRVTCQKGECSNCTLFWKDRNKDGKIQPGKELRCVCLKTKELCKISGKRVKC